jgi:uncharacterized protein DUF6627
MNTFNRCIARVLIVCTLGMSMPVSSLAGIVTTDQVTAGVERDLVRSFLDRDDVRTRLQELGVDPAAARARVDALNGDEVAALAGRIDQLPAGGAELLGVLLFVFIVLLITDILGLTKVFPFTKPMR